MLLPAGAAGHALMPPYCELTRDAEAPVLICITCPNSWRSPPNDVCTQHRSKQAFCVVHTVTAAVAGDGEHMEVKLQLMQLTFFAF